MAPYDAFVVRGNRQIVTNFNYGTTDAVSVGLAQANANELVAAQSVHAGAVIVLEYFTANDGVCAPVPNGATALAC